jgi:hypothetical protein
MGQLAILRDELLTDSLGRGYAGMTDLQAADDLNLLNRSRNKVTMEAHEVFNSIDQTEFNALTEADKLRIFDVLHMGAVNPFGLEAAIFVDVFGGGSTTITALQAARVENISRATELGLANVREGTVNSARS